MGRRVLVTVPPKKHVPKFHVPSCRALVEESRKRRLLEDSDSEEDTTPTQPQPALRPNPTAILDEVIGATRIPTCSQVKQGQGKPGLGLTLS